MVQRGGAVRDKFLYWNPAIKQLKNFPEVVIYGAGVMGRALKACITDEPYNNRVICFLVEKIENNPSMIENIPVVELEHAETYKNSLILAALHEKHMDSAVDRLIKEGFTNVLPVSFDGDIWSDIRGNWFRQKALSNNKIYVDLDKELNHSIHVYVIHNEYDRKLKETEKLKDYEIPLQAGAALANKVLCPVQDNQGENISKKNRQYCELTALYWIWKNDTSELTGLCHYRRKFEISSEQMRRVLDSDIDVIMTVPVLNFPNVREQFCKDHSEKDWNIMLEAIDELCPDYKETMQQIQNGNYYYGYNMFIARKEILNQYCEWLFPILLFCEEKIGIKNDTYQNRYIGFLAERLLTVFFEHNKQYKLAVAKKHFIESK